MAAKTITRSIRLNSDQMYKLNRAIEILNKKLAPAKVTGQTLFICAFEEYLEKFELIINEAWGLNSSVPNPEKRANRNSK